MPGMTAFRAVMMAALACGLTLAQDPASQTATGRWRGSIEIPGQQLGVIVDLVRAGDDWKGSIDIPSQGARNAPLSGVAVVDRAVSFALEGLPGDPLFRGKLSDDGKTLSGVFRQGPGQFPFRLTRQEGVAEADLGPNQPSRPSVEGVPGEGFAGVWLGDIEGGAVQLRLLVRLAQDGEGRWSGSIDSLDQGAAGLKIADIEIKNDLLRFSMARPPAAYEGLLAPDGSSINGLWSQNGAEMPLVLHRQQGEPDTARAQDPKAPLPYDEIEVRYDGAGVELAGTLSVPPGDGPFPAVLLLTGSGPQDRNETVMGHRPFLVLADALTREGVAVLRVDDRGVGGSTGDVLASTIDDYAADALAGVAFLTARAEVDARRIGLIGHSEGCWTAALAASRSADAAFVVLLANPSLSGEETIYLQSRRIGERSMMGDDEALDANERLQRRLFAIVKAEPDDERAGALMETLLDEEIDELLADQPEQLREALRENAKLMRPNAWFRYVLSYDPLPPLRKLAVPVLALYGENDLQVPPPENMPPLRTALEAAPTDDFSIIELPGLNHLFQTSDSGLPDEYARIEETFAPSALARIAAWVGRVAESQANPVR